MSEQEYSSEESNVLSRENTMGTNSEIYQSDFETSDENTMLTDKEMYADSREQSCIDHHSTEVDDEMEKEDSVLIERDGKFELLDKSELEASELEMLGLSNETTSPKSTKLAALNADKISSEYAHVTSTYGLTETQKEINKKKISVRQMRMNEEKQRLLEEEERQKVANEKSYRKWLSQKSASSNCQGKKGDNDIATNEERRKLAQKSYNLWLKEKELKQKEERKIEKIRLADEAEHYIVRDRKMCERSFRQWLKQKKLEEENNKIHTIEKPRKKTATKVRQRPITSQQKPQSAALRQKLELTPEEQKFQFKKSNKYTSNFSMFGN